MSGEEVGTVIRTLRRLAPAGRPTAMAEVAAEQPDPFRVLIACILSLRTQDATTRDASERLFRVADTPAARRVRLWWGVRRVSIGAITRGWGSAAVGWGPHWPLQQVGKDWRVGS